MKLIFDVPVMDPAEINAVSDETLYLSSSGDILIIPPHQYVYYPRPGVVFPARIFIFDSSEETIFRSTMD